MGQGLSLDSTLQLSSTGECLTPADRWLVPTYLQRAGGCKTQRKSYSLHLLRTGKTQAPQVLQLCGEFLSLCFSLSPGWVCLFLQMATAHECCSWGSYISFWIFWRNMQRAGLSLSNTLRSVRSETSLYQVRRLKTIDLG